MHIPPPRVGCPCGVHLGKNNPQKTHKNRDQILHKHCGFSGVWGWDRVNAGIISSQIIKSAFNLLFIHTPHLFLHYPIFMGYRLFTISYCLQNVYIIYLYINNEVKRWNRKSSAMNVR